MIIAAAFLALAACLAFVWIVDANDFVRRTAKRMVRPPFPPPDDKNGASNMYTVYFASPGSTSELRHLSRDRWPSKSFVDFPEALLWARAAAAKGTVVLRIEGAGLELDRGQIAGCLNALR